MSPASPTSVRLPTSRDGAEALVRRARRAQAGWARLPLARRLEVVSGFRGQLASDATTMADAVGRPGTAGRAESLSAEVIPLADACRWLERQAAGVLAPRALGRRGRPGWLVGATGRIRREPIGVVLVLAPSNYPLFLPGVQILQALVAGNAVLAKPAPGCTEPLRLLRDWLIAAGLDPELLVVLGEDIKSAEAVLDARVDKVFLTGSATTGRSVLARLAATVTPAVMELSGCDAVFVCSDADLDLVARALRFGLTFNGSRTCIAPRRVFVPRAQQASLEAALVRALDALPPDPQAIPPAPGVEDALQASLAAGARLLWGDPASFPSTRPVVLTEVRPDMAVAQEDLFAPVLSVLPVDDEEDALRQAAACPYALGASVFGSPSVAERLAGRVNAGLVTVNDLIVPSADPRLPFGGRGMSGFGTTRGPDGLLEMTVPKAVVVRRGRSRPHLDPARGGEADLFAAWVRMAHGPTWRQRWQGLRELVRAGRALGKGGAGPAEDRGGGE